MKIRLIAEDNGDLIGWLRWGLFWDNTPMMNMLYLLKGHRNKGYGKEPTTRNYFYQRNIRLSKGRKF